MRDPPKESGLRRHLTKINITILRDKSVGSRLQHVFSADWLSGIRADGLQDRNGHREVNKGRTQDGCGNIAAENRVPFEIHAMNMLTGAARSVMTALDSEAPFSELVCIICNKQEQKKDIKMINCLISGLEGPEGFISRFPLSILKRYFVFLPRPQVALPFVFCHPL
jgi:hypothetical protein